MALTAMWKLEMLICRRGGATSVKDSELLQDVNVRSQVSLNPRIVGRPAAIVLGRAEPCEQGLVDIRGKTAGDGLRGHVNTEGELGDHSVVHHGDQVLQLLHLCLSGKPN